MNGGQIKQHRESLHQVVNQRKFLILLTLYENEDWQRGFTMNNVLAELAENVTLWLSAGQVRENKLFKYSLGGDLKNLVNDGALAKKSKSLYAMGSKFFENFKYLIQTLFRELGCVLDENEYFTFETGKEELEQYVAQSLVSYSIRDFDGLKNKNLLIMTREQIHKLVLLCIRFDLDFLS